MFFKLIKIYQFISLLDRLLINKVLLLIDFRQNLNPNHDWEAMKETKLNKVINHYRHVGWTGTFPAAAAR